MSETSVEKRCDRCKQVLLKGEGYAETDIGSGKWVHWPSCPEKVPEIKLPERRLFRHPSKGEIYLAKLDLVRELACHPDDVEDCWESAKTSPISWELVVEKRSLGSSSPEKPVSREAVEAEIDVLIDNLADAMRRGGDIPAYLREALRKSFMKVKENPENPHPPVSSGKFTVRFNEGTDKQEDIVLEAPSTAAATILAARKYYEKHGAYPTTAKLKK